MLLKGAVISFIRRNTNSYLSFTITSFFFLCKWNIPQKKNIYLHLLLASQEELSSLVELGIFRQFPNYNLIYTEIKI
jgi:hypothetical protein